MAAKAQETQRQGVVWISSGGGIYYSAPRYDGETILELSKHNEQWNRVVKNLLELIFEGKPSIRVVRRDGDDKKDDTIPKLEARYKEMLSARRVRFYSKPALTFKDTVEWGGSPYNQVWKWKKGGINGGSEYVLTELTRLHPKLFTMPPSTRPYIYSEILRGVVPVFDEEERFPGDQGLDFWQTRSVYDTALEPPTSSHSLQERLEPENVFFIRNPTSEGPGGSPLLLPLIPIIQMDTFTWQAQIQKVNRIGAPLMFLEIMNPVGDDVEYGQRFLENWGKDSAMQKRPNMRLIIPDLHDSSTALDTITMLDRIVLRFITPAAILQKEGAVLGGNAAAELEMVYKYIGTQHEWLRDEWEPFLQKYLDANGWGKDYAVKLDFQTPSINLADLYMKMVRDGFDTQTVGLDERRRLMTRAGGDLPVLDEGGKAALKEEFAAMPPPGGGLPFGMQQDLAQAQIMAETVKANPYNPLMGRKNSRRFIQKKLGMPEEPEVREEESHEHGGSGSGNYGHEEQVGEVGGSSPAGGGGIDGTGGAFDRGGWVTAPSPGDLNQGTEGIKGKSQPAVNILSRFTRVEHDNKTRGGN